MTSHEQAIIACKNSHANKMLAIYQYYARLSMAQMKTSEEQRQNEMTHATMDLQLHYYRRGLYNLYTLMEGLTWKGL